LIRIVIRRPKPGRLRVVLSGTRRPLLPPLPRRLFCLRVSRFFRRQATSYSASGATSMQCA
jgi:hypothetical protein